MGTVMSESAVGKLSSALSRVNWDFPGSTTLSDSIHLLHKFPGNFIPEIPSYLVQLLTKAGDIVFDPFCGSGTTGVEAVALGRRAWQCDANRVSALVAEAKLLAVTRPPVVDHLARLAERVAARGLFSNVVDPTQQMERSREKDSELRSWFHPETLAGLSRVWDEIGNMTNDDARTVALAVFSDTLFACASPGSRHTRTGLRRRHHWGWIADNVKPRQLKIHDAGEFLAARLEYVRGVIGGRQRDRHSEWRVWQGDARAIDLPDESVDAVITSPPYLGMIDYALANRLTYLWCGWSLADDRQREIGSRARRGRRDAKETYLAAMQGVIGEIARVLRNDGYCAVVLGCSRKYPGVAAEVLGEFGRSLRPVWGPVLRLPSRRRVSERAGRQSEEFVCVYRKRDESLCDA
jgi:DNA methylase